MPRLQEIHANLVDCFQEARDQGWLGEVAAIETAGRLRRDEAALGVDRIVWSRSPAPLGDRWVRSGVGGGSPGV
ncbi:hypothetical protein J2S51_000037 [Streptomyces sp. DSM 41269]|nr:hypothetical protein [Streptomyces sp. DSM 41269]